MILPRQYLDLRFDVMLGGGADNFRADSRKDKVDLLQQYRFKGYAVVTDRNSLLKLPVAEAPLLGVFYDGGLPYALDRAHDETLQKQTPTLAETTDHVNANPGLFSAGEGNKKFDLLQQFKHTNDWVLNGINRNFKVDDVMDRLHQAQGFTLKKSEAEELLKSYTDFNKSGLYNPKNLPFKTLAMMQSEHTGIGWGSMNHAGDYVELAMFGPGKELLKPFVKNIDLHHLMLQVTGVSGK